MNHNSFLVHGSLTGQLEMRVGVALEFDKFLETRRALVESKLAEYLSCNDPPELWESMRYSVLSGGKRLRAILCLAAAEAAGSDSANREAHDNPSVLKALPCACAIEMIHAMSLIHDDLPCMDDDDFRRGKASNHKVFGEAMALLAGDALLVYANQILLEKTSAEVDRTNLIEVSKELSKATGAHGMVGGQVLDMSMTGMARTQDKEPMNLLTMIHERKTGALIEFSIWSGACLMGANQSVLSALSEFGKILGLSFQIADDLLDETGDIKTLGKTPGKDKAAGKLTWISLHGKEKAILKLAELEDAGNKILEKTGLGQAGLAPLRALLQYAIHRSH